MTQNCKDLDAYMIGALPTTSSAHFAAHLSDCDDCRETVEQQRWIDGLIASPAACELEAPPDDVLLTLRASIAQKQRRAKRIAGGSAAAAAILIAAGWTIHLRHHDQQLAFASAATTDGSTNQRQIVAAPRTVSSPRATFTSTDNSIAIPLESHHPNVTVVRVYPAFRPSIDRATAAFEPDAATDINSTYFSNGG
jgi:anti-sigma factor RsiW